MERVKGAGGRPPQGGRKPRATLVLKPALLAEVKALAQRENRTVSNALELLIERGLRAYVNEVAV